MAVITFVQEGTAIDYAPQIEVPAGAVVVQNDLVGITTRKILASQQGALAVTGVFEFPKATGAGTALDVGIPVYWDVAEQVAKGVSEAGANKLLGKSTRAASDNDTTIRVRMSQ